MKLTPAFERLAVVLSLPVFVTSGIWTPILPHARQTLFPTAMAYERSTILHTNRSIRPTLPRCGKRHQRNNRTWLEWSLGNICLYIQIQALWMWHTKTIEEQLRLLLFPSLLETNSSCMGCQYGNFQIIKILLCIK